MSWDDKWPYHVSLYRDDWDIIENWCKIYIGEFDQEWYKLGIDPAAYVIDGSNRTSWYFKHEKDAILFRLKWA